MLLTGCVRPISPATLPDNTPPIVVTAANTASPLPNDSSPSPLESPTRTVETSQPLIAVGSSELPLATGNTWVYQAEVYHGEERAEFMVTDTVVKMVTQGERTGARLERTVQSTGDKPPSDQIDAPVAEIYWLVLDRGKMYRIIGEELDWETVSNGRLEYVFPFAAETCWLVDNADRQQIPNPELGSSGCRSAEGSHPITVRAGNFNGCTTLTTPYNSGPLLDEFCPGVGIVSRKYDHLGTPYGYRWELVGYLIQNSEN